MVADLKTYHAEVDRDGRVWRVRVPEVQRTTQARNLREVEPMARDLIAIMDDIPADSFSLDVTITLPADVQQELERSAALRQEAARSQAAAAAAARGAARRLRDQGLPLQDVGQALGVSFQRAKQLIDEADKLAS
ncbi:MAG TPA: type II toxin-antitoxin system HicB family antitoxin [Streptosporangiaceae bacterium]|nr:type II toxin-antitoxin system HicB family antitoxin [Streptosporangiaceae bacterium]